MPKTPLNVAAVPVPSTGVAGMRVGWPAKVVTAPEGSILRMVSLNRSAT